MNEIERKVTDLANTPRLEWRVELYSMLSRNLDQAASYASVMALAYAELSAYLDARGGGAAGMRDTSRRWRVPMRCGVWCAEYSRVSRRKVTHDAEDDVRRSQDVLPRVYWKRHDPDGDSQIAWLHL